MNIRRPKINGQALSADHLSRRTSDSCPFMRMMPSPYPFLIRVPAAFTIGGQIHQ